MDAPRTVLIVEDNRDISEAIGAILEDEGYLVAFAGNGVEAFDWLQRHPAPALILLDLMMPIMDGRQFLVRRRESGEASEVPVVLMSAAGHNAARAVQLGAEAVLHKPVQLEELLDAIQRLSAGG